MALVMLSAARMVSAAVPSPWLAQDIGAPSPAGSSSASSGTFTITASGADVAGTSDQFHFVYQQVSGDFTVSARVDSITNTNAWAKAGVMIRTSLAANSAEVFATVTPGAGVTFQERASAGATTTLVTTASGTAPRWVRLARSGTNITASTSADGATWTALRTVTVGLGSSVYVGLAVTSHSAGVSTTASISNVSLAAATTSAGPVPAPQKDSDIGSPAIAGSATYSSGKYTINAAGSDIWNSSDQFHYVYQPLSGDAEVIARVAGLGNSSIYAKAGVMVRETLAANSRHADAVVTSGNGIAFQRRIDAGGTTIGNTVSGAAPKWVRLVRSGYTFTAYQSSDGKTWSAIGPDTVPMTDPVYVGIAVTSHNTALGTTANVDSFTVTASGAPSNQPPSVSLTSPASSASFTAPATISLAATASDPENRMSHVDFYAGTSLLASDTATPYTFTWSSVPAGTYAIKAIAYDADGGSASSSIATVTVAGSSPSPADTQAPTAPTNLATTVASNSQINLTWSKSTDNVSVSSYIVERCQGSGCSTFTQTGTSTTNSYSVSGLSASTSYSFRVRAADAAGNLGAYSATASATTTGTTSSSGLPAKFTGGYIETWYSQRIQDLPAGYNLLFSAFANIDSAGTASYWPGSGESQADFIAGIAAKKAAGTPVILSIAGAGGAKAPLNPGSQEENFMSSIQSIINTYGFSGIDWDMENDIPSGPISVAGLVDISKRLKSIYGPNFLITMAPYNQTDNTYLQIATQIRDILSFVGYQNYNMGSIPTTSSVRSTMERWMSTAGLRPDQWSLGFLHVDDYLGLTTPFSNMVSIYNDINAIYPTVRGVWTWGVYQKDQPLGYPFVNTLAPVVNR